MTEPPTPSSPPTSDPPAGSVAEPFEPGPASLPGCGKPAVIGCLVVLAVLAVLAVVFVSQSPRLARTLVEQMRSDVTAALPEDLEDAERRRLDAAFDDAIAALMEGRVDSSSVTRLQRLAALLPGRGETLSREEVTEITELLEAIGAVPAPEAAAAAGAADASTI